MITHLKRVVVAIPAVALALCLAGTYLTRGAMAHLSFANDAGSASGTSTSLVDQRPWQTAQALAPLAVSAEEQGLAREAQRLADHSVDQAFALALRQASLHTRTLTGDALALQQQVTALAAMVKEDSTRVAALIASAPKGPDGNPDSDDLDVAKAQAQLDTDELNDATDQLARVSGDKRAEIQQELAAREASMKKFDEQSAGGGQIAVLSAQRDSTLYTRARSWFDQRSRLSLLDQARAEADSQVSSLASQRTQSGEKATAAEAKAGAANAAAPTTAAQRAANGTAAKDRVFELANAHAMAQMHSILDDRLQTERQLAAVYEKWIAQVQLQHRIEAHLLLQSLSVVAFLVLFAVVAIALIDLLLGRSSIDHRKARTVGTVVTLAIEVLTVLLILLVIFGAPNQMPTILGLATAGLTVVFQDFILAFFGWFVLMGHNGIRVGDWVEINGVGGEVVEIGVFRTALLETGNWTDKGHPTGRRVTFINNFAISGQFFNFSTAGQWMWDEIRLNVPAGEGTYETIEAIHKVVLQETEKDAKLAEAEWKGATKQHTLSQFSAAPSVDMRPAASGIDILVRYVTRAGDRFEMRNKLYQAVIDLLHKPAELQAPPTAPTPAQ